MRKRFSVMSLPNGIGLGVVYDTVLKDLHIYFFHFLITIDCYRY